MPWNPPNYQTEPEPLRRCLKLIIRVRLLYRPMKKKVKGDGWLTGLSR